MSARGRSGFHPQAGIERRTGFRGCFMGSTSFERGCEAALRLYRGVSPNPGLSGGAPGGSAAGRLAGQGRRGRLAGFANLEDLGAAIRAHAFSSRAAILHGHLFGVLDFLLGPALHAIAFQSGPSLVCSRKRFGSLARFTPARRFPSLQPQIPEKCSGIVAELKGPEAACKGTRRRGGE